MKSLKQLILFAFLCFFFVSSYGQNIFKAMLKDVESKAALIDATVQGSRFGFDSFSDMLNPNNEIRSYFDV